MKHFISSLSVINANTPPCEGRVSSRKFLSLLLILFLGVTNAWAETASITFSEKGLTNGVQYLEPFTIDANTTITFAGGDNDGKYYTTGSGMRTYGGGTVTIACANGIISEISFTWSGTNNTYKPTDDVATPAGYSTSTGKWTGSASSVTLTRPSGSGHWRLQKVTVTYETAGGSETPEPDPDPTPDPEPEPEPGTGGTGTINFNSSAVKINAASVTGNDDLGNTWTITTVGTTSYTASNAYYQVGSGSKPATSITFTTTLPSEGNITAFSAKFGGFNGTAGTVTLKVDDTSVGTGSLNATSDVTISNSSQATGKKLTITVTGIAKGVKVYYISYTYTTYSGGSEPETPATELKDAQFAWSAQTAEATMGASNTFPTLTNTLPVTVTYESSKTDAATIAADGTITLVAPGTTTISAKFAGGEVSGTIYAPKTVTYALTILKAPATPTENMYVKVTDAVTDGEYLIVYETSKVAFNGALETLDVASNTVEVTISDNVVAGNTEIDAATFTIDAANGTILSASGKYIGGKTSADNGINVSANALVNSLSIDGDGNAVIISNEKGLRYNKTAGQTRFRYFKDNGGTQEKIQLYKKVDPNAVVEPIFTLVAGEYYGTQSVTISCATAGAEVYYTLDGTDPTSESTKYTGAISIASTTTIKAIAVKGANSSAVVSATYTILAPLATMQAIFDKATEIGKDAVQSVKITFDEWVISAVVPGKDEKPSSNAYITDGDKGFIIYTSTGHGFKVGDKLSGTITCDLTLYNGSAEVKGLISTTTGLTVVENGTITPVELNATQIEELSGVNTGSVIKITGPCTVDGTKYYVADVQLYNSLYSYTDLTAGNKYNVTGVYLQYNAISEILPRSEADIEEIIDLPTATISIANITMEVDEEKTIEATITPDAAQSTVQYAITSGNEYITLDGTTITAVAAGEATITATIAEVAGEYYGATKIFTVTIKPQNIATLPFTFDKGKNDIASTLGMSQKNLGSDYTSEDSPKLKFDDTDDNVIIHFDSEPVELSFTLKQNGNSVATYTVYESEDGNTFSPVWVAGEIGYGKTQDVTVSLSDAARYVKFEYTNKISGTNYALGKISITNTYSTPTTLSGKFSTGEYEYAEFATGNLQYKKEGENETWRFAKQQYQVVGDDNINVGDPAFEGWIDMFGWSTSETNYGVDPRNENVYYDGAFVDWSNLFPGEGWSTLSADQWKYLLNTRPNASSLKQIARVGSVVGIMLFPDNWNAPLTVTAQRDSYFDVDIHNYTLDQWAELEEAGALFLPAAGRRAGGYGNMINKDQVVETNPANLNGGHYKHQDNTNIYCYYWTSTINEDKNVSYLHNIQALGGDKYTIGTGAVWGEKGRYGQSVRLAKVTKQYYTREVDPQYYGTICLAKAAKFEGGSLYEVSYFDESTKKVYFDEIENGMMEAGMPYVFLAEKNVICAYYTSDTEESAQDKDGLYGTLVDITSGMNADGVYMIYRNQIIHSTHPGSYLNANRAYIKLKEVPGYNDPSYVAPAPAPGRKRIAIGQAPQVATGMESVDASAQPVKMIIDGQLFILRGEKMYDAQGKLVK